MKLKNKIATTLLLFAITISAYGQDEESENKLSVDIGADLVSSYIWRGMEYAGISIQPALSISFYGLTFGAWGSASFSTIEKEVDLYFSYEIKGLSVGLTNYWWYEDGVNYFKDKESHLLDATIGYTFPEKFPLSLEISTMIDGEGDKDEKGKKYYSTYISASFPFSIDQIDCELGIGVSPWKGMYSEKFDVASISAKATKNLQLSSKYSLPVFTEFIISPTQNKVYLVFGLKF